MKRYICASTNRRSVPAPWNKWYKKVDERWIEREAGLDSSEYLDWLPIIEKSGYKFLYWVGVKARYSERFAYQYPEVSAMVEDESGSTMVVEVSGKNVYPIRASYLEDL